MPKTADPYKIKNGLKVMDLENYITYHFTVIANRTSRGASALFRKEFGVGVVEWRCMVMLAMQEGVSAARISEVSGINKSLVSRSLAKLEKLDHVEDYHGSTSRKPRLLQFTESGRSLYSEMVERMLQREAKLRQGLTAKDLNELLRMLRILFDNTDQLDQLDYHIDLAHTKG